MRRKKKKKKRRNSFDNEDIFGHEADKAELEPSVTDTFYQEFMHSPNYILTSQPKLIEELSSESEEDYEISLELIQTKDSKIN